MRARLLVFFPIALAGCAQTATISGVVTDAVTHLPLAGAAVTANGAIMRTDDEGRYSLSVSPSQSVQIAANRTEYFAPSSATPVSIAAGQTVLRNFELRPRLKFSGIVRNYDTGEPIKGCHVFALQRIYAVGRAWFVPAGLITADTRIGRFVIRNLEPGDYVLEIVPEETTPVIAADSKTEPSPKFHGWSYYPDASRIEMAVPITLTPAGDVPVIIRLRNREPHAISGDVTVPASLELLRIVAADVRTVATGTVATAGPFRIGNLPEGDYQLIARTVDGMTARATVTIGDHDVTDLHLSPAPARIITGTVRMDDPTAPLPATLHFSITPAHPGQSSTLIKQTRVTDGRFQIATDTDDFYAQITGLPDGYIEMPESGSASQQYVIVKAAHLSGTVKNGLYVLLPGGTTLTEEFTIDLAPGIYQIAKLEGEENKLIRNKEFLKAKAAEARITIELHPGETKTLTLP